MLLDIPIWLLWSVSLLIAAAVPCVIYVLYRMNSDTDGVDGSPHVRGEDSYDWALYLTEDELIVLASLQAQATMRLYWGKDISNIV